MRRQFSKVSIILRAAGMVGIMTALAGGVTYAALQSQATMTNNTIASATAGLDISTDGGATYGSSAPGLAFTGIVPGGAASANKSFKLRNSGTAALNISAIVPTVPTFTVSPSGSVDQSKVWLTVHCTSGASGTLDLTDNLQHLFGSSPIATAGPLAAGDIATCTAKISMDADAFTGASATSSAFDVVFRGTGV